VEAMPTQPGRIALFRSAGFEPVRRFAVMHRAIDDDVPLEPLPPELLGCVWQPEFDEAARVAHNEAFADHWGSEPVSAERWRHLGSGGPGFRADLSFVALTPAREVAGYVVSSAPPGMQTERPSAWIGMVGVRREHRRRGLAAALLTRSLAAMRAAGFAVAGLDVDADNATGAVRLYERLGFQVVREQLIYSKAFDG
jgi:mycothiol synthase